MKALHTLVRKTWPIFLRNTTCYQFPTSARPPIKGSDWNWNAEAWWSRLFATIFSTLQCFQAGGNGWKWNQAFMAQELRLLFDAFWDHLPSFRGPLSPSLPSSRLIQQSGPLRWIWMSLWKAYCLVEPAMHIGLLSLYPLFGTDQIPPTWHMDWT